MSQRDETPAGTGASVDPSDVGDAETKGSDVVPVVGGPLDDGWSTLEGLPEPLQVLSGVQWGTYMRLWSLDTGEWLSDAVLIATALAEGLSLREAVIALGHYTTMVTLPQVEVPVVTAQDCPRPKPLWYINGNTLGFSVNMIPCTTWACAVCGPARVRRLARRFEDVFEPFHGAWWGEVPGDSGAAMIRKRREKASRAGRVVGGWRITLAGRGGVEVSTTALVGKVPPTTGQWFTPRAVAHRLVELHEREPESFVRVDRNGDLDEHVEEAVEVDPEALPSAVIFLLVGDRRLRDEVTARVHELAVRLYGVDPADKNFRYSVPRRWLLDTFKRFADEATEARRAQVGW